MAIHSLTLGLFDEYVLLYRFWQNKFVSLTVFPNPTTHGHLELIFNNLQQKVTNINAKNNLGITVLPSKPSFSTENTISINLASLPDGLYFIMVILADGTPFTKKVVLQKGVIVS